MGARGPLPKTNHARISRNEERKNTVVASGTARRKVRGVSTWHPVASDFWRSLGESPVAEKYEVTDWAFAKVLTQALSEALESGNIQGVATLLKATDRLLVTHADRVRWRLEIDRAVAAPGSGNSDGADNYKPDDIAARKRRLTG